MSLTWQNVQKMILKANTAEAEVFLIVLLFPAASGGTNIHA